MPASANRKKISTTVAPKTDDFLKSLVRSGKAANLAAAVDRVVEIARRAESRRQLEAATVSFYESLSGRKRKKEKQLELTMGKVNSLVDYDGE